MSSNEHISTLFSCVEILSNNQGANEMFQEANNWICTWIQSDYLFNDFHAVFEIFSSNPHDQNTQKVLFVTLKAIQESIRMRFGSISQEIIVDILNLTWRLSLDPNLMSISREFSFLIICDIFSLSQKIEPAIIESIPNDYKMHFFALLFEVGHEEYLKRYPINNSIQSQLLLFGIELLSNSPMSLEWLRIASSLLPDMDGDVFLNHFSKLIPKLYESIGDINMMKLTADIIATIYSYSYTIYQSDFLFNLIQFTISFSTQLKQLIANNHEAAIFLYSIWEGFFQLDCDEIANSPAFYKLFVSVLREIFTVCSVIPPDFEMWDEFCMMIISFFQTFGNTHPVFYYLMDLFNLFTSIVNTGVPPNSLKKSLSELHFLSQPLLCNFLEEVQPKTPGTLLIAAFNAEYLPHQLLQKFLELIFTNNFPLPHVSIFLRKTFRIINGFPYNYVQIIRATLKEIPKYQSKTLYLIFKEKHGFISSDISEALFDFLGYLKFTDTQTHVYIIPSILYSFTNNTYEKTYEICMSIGSYILQHSHVIFSQEINQIPQYVNYLYQLIIKIPRKSEANKQSILIPFYHSLFINLLQLLKQIYLLPDESTQENFCRLFMYIIDEQLIEDATYFVEWLESISQMNILTSLHFKLLTKIPFMLCNNMINFIRSVNENVDPEILNGISYFMEYVATNHFDIFPNIFSQQLILFIIIHSYSIRDIFNTLKNIIESNQINIDFALVLLKTLLSKCENSDSLYPNQLAVLVDKMAPKIPSNLYFGAFAEVFSNCRNEQIVFNYANALVNKELGQQFVAEATAAFFDYVRFNARRENI